MKPPVHAFEKQSSSPRLAWTPRKFGSFSFLAIGLAALFNFGTAESQAAGTVTNCTEEAFRFALTGGGSISFTGNCSLTLTGSVNIAANTSIETGSNVVTLSGGDTNRIFTVASNVSFSITGLTLRNGRSTNGGALLIANNATVQLTNCTLSANNAFGPDGISGNNGQTNVSGHGSNGSGGTSGAPGIGGAIYNLGSLLLINCTLSTNIAIGGDGGDGGDGGNGEFRGGNGGSGATGGIALGGAIYNLGTLSARDCTFSRNAASGGFGGLGGLGGSAPDAGLAGNGAAGRRSRAWSTKVISWPTISREVSIES
jgi:hypothetical protein